MDLQFSGLHELSVRPLGISLYLPPIVWKGDSVGHIGENDLFFFVLEGECFLHIDAQSYIVRPGQLAYLPKGKMRAYTHVSERFSMYEMAFSAKANGHELMPLLGLDGQDFVVDVPDPAAMSALFESSHRKELYKNPLYDIAWCENIIHIIRIYAEQRQRLTGSDALVFKPLLEHMTTHMDQSLCIEDMAAIVYMQPTYFIKKFHKAFGLPPLAYFNRLKMYQAMGMLAGTELSVGKIAVAIGVPDAAYFARLFKKHCGLTPVAYRAQFKHKSKI